MTNTSAIDELIKKRENHEDRNDNTTYNMIDKFIDDLNSLRTANKPEGDIVEKIMLEIIDNGLSWINSNDVRVMEVEDIRQILTKHLGEGKEKKMCYYCHKVGTDHGTETRYVCLDCCPKVYVGEQKEGKLYCDGGNTVQIKHIETYEKCECGQSIYSEYDGCNYCPGCGKKIIWK